MSLQRLAILTLLSVSGLVLGGCSSSPNGDFGQEVEMGARPSIADIIERRGSEFLAIDGVVVIFEGATAAGDPCIKIGIAKLNKELDAKLPEQIEGWPVVVFESGVIQPMDD
jgi:hypothetical protein